MADNASEVARLRERLEQEYASLTMLNGFGVTASHESITKRMELFADSLNKTKEQLTPLIGEAATAKVVAEVLLIEE